MVRAVPLGQKCGMKVSELCLGTMNFGIPGRGHQGDWTLTKDQTKPIIKAAMDCGIFYFDCADVYGLGGSEEVMGSVLRSMFNRSDYVITTKVSYPMGSAPNLGGLSRKHILEGIDASLARLGLDYVDQLIIHRHPHGVRDHTHVPIEETMEALHEVVKSGKALYLGASSMFAWQFAELQGIATQHGWTEFVSMQNHYNLIYREEEREMIPYCKSTGVALTPWSPLARGILAGSYGKSLQEGKTVRSAGRDRDRTASLYRGEVDFDIAGRVAEVATKYGKTQAQIAIAWLTNKPEITAPVVGVSKVAQLTDLASATEIVLDEADVLYLEELYRPVENLLSLGTS